MKPMMWCQKPSSNFWASGWPETPMESCGGQKSILTPLFLSRRWGSLLPETKRREAVVGLAAAHRAFRELTTAFLTLQQELNCVDLAGRVIVISVN